MDNKLEESEKISRADGDDDDEPVEFCWWLFSMDVCGIVRKDLQSLFVDSSGDETEAAAESVYLDAEEQQKMDQRRQLNENGKILMSNKYGKMFILYPSRETLLAFDSVQATKSFDQAMQVNEKDPQPVTHRGLQPAQKIYRVFKNLKGHSMQLFGDEQYIGICSDASFDCYHTAQFFNHHDTRNDNLRPLWSVAMPPTQRIIQFDGSDQSLFLLLEEGRRRFVQYYKLSTPMHASTPALVGTPLTLTSSQALITHIRVFGDTNIVSVCADNGCVFFYQYESSDGSHRVIHTLELRKHVDAASDAIPFLLTWMPSCRQICVNFAVPNEQKRHTFSPFICFFEHEAVTNTPATISGHALQRLKCIASEHTGFPEMERQDFRDAIRSVYVPVLDYLVLSSTRSCEPVIYGTRMQAQEKTRCVLSGNDVHIKYDEDRNKGNVCDMAVDVCNTLTLSDIDPNEPTYPPVPILVLLSNKLNVGYFNLIVNDANVDMTATLPLMRAPVASLPPIPIAAPPAKAAMKPEVLAKYKRVYRDEITKLYRKYNPDKVGNVDSLVEKYSASVQLLSSLYRKIADKYNVPAEERMQEVAVEEIDEKQQQQQAMEHQAPPKLESAKEEEKADDHTWSMSSLSVGARESIPLLSQVTPDKRNREHKQSMQSSLLIPMMPATPQTPTTTSTKHKRGAVNPATAKPAFSSQIFDRNVPNEQVAYEFFNALKQIQVEMERLGQERDALAEDMQDTRAVLENRSRHADALSIDECAKRLHALHQTVQNEKQAANDQQSTLQTHGISHGMHAQHHSELYTQAMDLKARTEKLSDATYQKALQMRGLDEKQEDVLIRMDATLKEIGSRVQSWREYHNDENAMAVRRAQATPHKIYHSCQRMEQLVHERYVKYLQLVSQTAPELMIENLHLSPSSPRAAAAAAVRIPTPPTKKSPNAKQSQSSSLQSFASSMRSALPSTPQPLFSSEESRVQYHRHRNLRAARHYNKSARRPPRPAGARLPDVSSLTSTSSPHAHRSYVYNSYVAPSAKPKLKSRPVAVQHLNIMHDLNASALSSHLASRRPRNLTHSNANANTSLLSASCDRYKRRKHKKPDAQHAAIDVTSFQTKIQRTPCKSVRTPQSLKKLASEKVLSRTQHNGSGSILQQQATNLEYTRTPGFGTVKRKDRRRAARFKTPPCEYKPPQKPLDFKEFSPEKKKNQSPIKQQQQQQQASASSASPHKKLSFTPNKTEQQTSSPLKVQQLQQQHQTVPKPTATLKSVAPPPAAKESTHEVVGLTTTPPALEVQDVATGKEPSAFSWGARATGTKAEEKEEKKQEKKKDGSSAAFPFGGGLSLSFEDDNASKNTASAQVEKKQQPQLQWGNVGGQSQPAQTQPQSMVGGMDPLTVYKQRISAIYQQTGDHSKLAKVLLSLELHTSDPNWMHALYVKICKKYKRDPEPMVGAQSSAPPQQQQQANSGWFGNNNNNSNNTQQSAWNTSTSGFGGNSNFGNLSDWGKSGQSQANSNGVFSAFGGGGGASGSNSQSGWDWGSSGQSNNNSSTSGNMSFASMNNNSNSQPSWLQSGPANTAAVDDGSNAFSQFTNSGGFASLMG